MPSLMDRLNSLGVTRGTDNIPPKKPVSVSTELAASLGGAYIDTIYGPVLRIEKHYPLGFQHGQICCIAPDTKEIFRQWGDLPPASPTDQLLFLDTETSGLSSGTGTFAFLVGIGFYQGDHFRLIQYFLESPARESAMLAALLHDSDHTSVFVTYNGKSFDIPLLRNRLILNRMLNPFDTYAHADLLHITRKLYRLLLPERNLGIVEKEILQFKRDELEVPGWMVPEIYAEFLQNQDPEPIRRVLYHNQMDILSLAALYLHLNQVLQEPDALDSPLPYPVTLAKIRLLIEQGHLKSAAQILSELNKPSDFREEFAKTCYLLGMAFKTKQLLDDAMQWWREAVENNYLHAWIEMAKVFEHREHDYAKALDCTQQALSAYSGQAGVSLAALEHRRERLIRFMQAE